MMLNFIMFRETHYYDEIAEKNDNEEEENEENDYDVSYLLYTLQTHRLHVFIFFVFRQQSLVKICLRPVALIPVTMTRLRHKT